MRHERGLTRWVGCSLVSAVLLVATSATLAGQGQKKFLTGPLTIEDQGSFFIGGVPKVTNHAAPAAPRHPGGAAAAPLPHQITIGQMYVQFQIPAKKYAGGWPVIMVHGSSHTGACLESTPDGREGWYPYFVRKGVPSYIVDQAGRGRSGFDESVIHEGEANIVAGDVSGGTALIPGFRANHRRRRLDQLVRPSHAGELDDPDRHADSPRRRQRSEPQPGRLQARGTAVPAR